MIDGGIGQLRAAEGVLQELGLIEKPRILERPQSSALRAAEESPGYGARTRLEGDAPPKRPNLVSLSKQEELVHTLALPAGVRISRRNVGLRMLQFVRDEAHRFAQHYHHILQRKRVLER